MRRTIELTGLAHRKYYRSLEGLEHWLRARFDTIAVSKARYTNVSLPRLQRMIEGAQTILASDRFVRTQRALERVQKVIELYEPFILDNEYFFVADHIKVLAGALPEEEIEPFGYDAEVIDWYDYWINFMSGAGVDYPLIEGASSRQKGSCRGTSSCARRAKRRNRSPLAMASQPQRVWTPLRPRPPRN